MKAEIKSISSPDIDDFKTYYPEDDLCFTFLLEITIGTKGDKGGDIFSIDVCTPKWLLENHNPYDTIFGRHKLIVFEYDIERIIKQITIYCESTNGDKWENIANKISRIALWEYEDYKD